MQVSSYTFQSDDGLDIYVRKWMPADEEPLKGIVQVSHGLAEHGRRYGELAERLTKAAYGVYVHDHRGHGRSVIESRDFGFFGRTNGWARAVKDLDRLNHQISDEHPGVPVVLLGHSMGAQLALQLIMQEGRDLAGVALSGPSGHVGLMRHIGWALARIERARLGEYGRSKLLNAMSFGEFNRGFEPSRTAFDWLSRDEAEVDKYINDPLCGFLSTTQLWVDMLGAISALQRPKSYKWTRPDLPVLVIVGEQDPVSNGGRAIGRMARILRKAGIQSVQIKKYTDCRHELLHEINRSEVMEDLLKWLDNLVSLSGPSETGAILPE